MRDVTVGGLGGSVAIELGSALSAAERDAVASAWRSALSAGIAPSQPVLRVDYGTSGAGSQVWAPGFEQVSALLTTRVTLALLEQAAGRSLLLHAAALSDRLGRVIAFVGPSGSGKTTLARALGSRMPYVTDESVAIDAETGVVHPYRKPLSIIEHPDLPKRQRSPADLGLVALPEATLTVGRIAVLDRTEGAAVEPVVEPLAVIDALVELVPQSSHLTALDRPLARLATWLDRTGGAVRIRYAEAVQLATVVEALLDSPPVSGSVWRSLDATGRSEGLRFGEVVDALLSDDRIAVLLPGRLHVLEGVALPIWEAVCDGLPIVPHVVARLGPPPEGDAQPAIDAAIAELVAAGVLRADR